MKNKTKKIFATACLGLVGMGCLTGCSMSDKQKAALDLITEKSDEIITLLEENMELQNAQLSKADAVELIALARTKLALSKYNEFCMKTSSMAYQGAFEKELGHAQGSAPYVYYKKTDKMKYVALCDFDGSLNSIKKADFENDTAYYYGAKENQKQDLVYSSGMFDLSSQIDPFTILGLQIDISVEDIVNIENTEKGYKFNVLSTIHDLDLLEEYKYFVDTLMATFEVSRDADILSGTFEMVHKEYEEENLVIEQDGSVRVGENGLPDLLGCNEIISLTYNIEYQYNNIDFKTFDDKIAEIEAE